MNKSYIFISCKKESAHLLMKSCVFNTFYLNVFSCSAWEGAALRSGGVGHLSRYNKERINGARVSATHRLAANNSRLSFLDFCHLATIYNLKRVIKHKSGTLLPKNLSQNPPKTRDKNQKGYPDMFRFLQIECSINKTHIVNILAQEHRCITQSMAECVENSHQGPLL